MMKVYKIQIQQKIAQLKRERKQVAKHLAFLESQIATLNNALEIMAIDKHAIQAHSTLHFEYVSNRHLFKSGLTKLIIQALKSKADTAFSLAELSGAMLQLDGQASRTLTYRQLEYIRRAALRLEKRGIIEKHSHPTHPRQVTWQWCNQSANCQNCTRDTE